MPAGEALLSLMDRHGALSSSSRTLAAQFPDCRPNALAPQARADLLYEAAYIMRKKNEIYS